MPENVKVITTEALIGKFRQALSEKWGYIWGTSGENWTAAKQKELEKTTDADRVITAEITVAPDLTVSATVFGAKDA